MLEGNPQIQAPSSIGLNSVDDDIFLNQVQGKTEGDQRNNQTNNGSEQPKVKQEPRDSDLSASLAVNLVDVLVQISCQNIADESDHELFKVSQPQKDQIEKPLADIFERYKLQVSPWLLLSAAIVAVYSVPVMKAVSIKNKKSKLKKPAEINNQNQPAAYPTKTPEQKKVEEELEVIRNKKRPGRPHGSTKQNGANKTSGRK